MQTEQPTAAELEQAIFRVDNAQAFAEIASHVFRFQYEGNPVYREFCRLIRRTPENITGWHEIPFLPVRFFRTHDVLTGDFTPELVFRSSGTTGSVSSVHGVRSADLYRTSFLEGFRQFFGEPAQFCILGLLPSYLEREDASLVYMVQHLVNESGHPDSGFYLYDHARLDSTLARLEASGTPVVLFGVTFALLDFAENYPRALPHVSIVETGGMKGRQVEITREELMVRLKEAFGVPRIWSEYGMTELLSQAYAKDGMFRCPPWMRVLVREETDPFRVTWEAERPVPGAINVIDLANLHSCSFIATDDAGRLHPGDVFEVTGRLDNSDIRGCSLMVASG